MPFLNLDDNFADHPRVWALSDAAFRLHVSGLLYCSRLRSDGFVPLGKVPTLVPRFRKNAQSELIEAERWNPVGLDETVSYEIRNYLEWNDSSEQIEERRRQAAARKAAWIAKQRNGDHDRDGKHV